MKTPFETSPPGPVSVDRVQLTLAAPLLLLLASSFVTWAWRALGLPGVAGGVSPLAALSILIVVFGGIYATQRRLPVNLFTWFPSGLAGVALLGGILAVEGDSDTAVYTARAIFPIVFLFAVVVSIAISKAGAYYGVAFAAIMFMAQVGHRFPLFAVESSGPVTAATLLTFVAAARAVVEIGVLLVLINRLFLDSARSTTWTSVVLIILVLAHGPLTAWEQPLLSGEGLNFDNYLANTLGWLLLAGFSMSAVTVFSRLRRSWVVESERAAEERAARPLEMEEPVDESISAEISPPGEDASEAIDRVPGAVPEPSEPHQAERPSTPRRRPQTFRRRRR